MVALYCAFILFLEGYNYTITVALEDPAWYCGGQKFVIYFYYGGRRFVKVLTEEEVVKKCLF